MYVSQGEVLFIVDWLLHPASPIDARSDGCGDEPLSPTRGVGGRCPAAVGSAEGIQRSGGPRDAPRRPANASPEPPELNPTCVGAPPAAHGIGDQTRSPRSWNRGPDRRTQLKIEHHEPAAGDR